ncbi:MAG: hypothetical protein IT376_20195 [Polyangiaceae bacterium]|nr:hypothetical protein [Polyangiaceae bacterium]
MTTRPPAPTEPALAATVDRLRAEHDAAVEGAVRAALLHEIGLLEEALGDEAGAARDHLAAVNAEPEFREPLERLIAIIERRQSFKNLGKLLERLSRVADSAEERARALHARAAFALDHDDDATGGRELAEEWVGEAPDDAAAWLLLECAAGRLEDAPLRLRAMTERAERARDPEWAALLWADLSSLELDADAPDRAFEAAERAAGFESGATWAALRRLEELATRAQRPDRLARVLETQAALLERRREAPAEGDRLGVPRWTTGTGPIADALLRAAAAARAHGDVGQATTLLDRALEAAPDEPSVLAARLAAAEAVGDLEGASVIARKALERGASGGVAAALCLKLAEAASAAGDAAGALAAAQAALGHDPGSIPARTLALDLLAGASDPPALAGLLESTAERCGADPARARGFLLAADAWARGNEPQAARAALSQAGMYGASPGVVARTARMLAGAAADTAWYDEATRRLMAAGADASEQASLAFELLRGRLQRGDATGAQTAASAIAAAPGGEWLGHALRAWLVVDGDGASAARDLAGTVGDDDHAAALRVVAAARALAGGRADEAHGDLVALAAEPGPGLIAAVAAAALDREAGATTAAAELLAGAGDRAEDAPLAAALLLEAGLLRWRAGDRAGALEAFRGAADRDPTGAGAVLGWALRSADPESIEARRAALASAPADDTLATLERYGLELATSDGAEAARAALEQLAAAPSPLPEVATLARALEPGVEHADDRIAALDELALLPGTTALVAGEQHLAALAGGAAGTAELAASAAAWAGADESSAAAALEWVARAVGAADPAAELDARRALAARLTEPASLEIECGVRMASALRGESEPLLGRPQASARAADLELAPPGSDPARRAAALRRANVLFGAETGPVLSALAGWNQLARGDLEGAQSSFRAVAEAHPTDVFGWDGLRAASEALGDRASVAEALAALGDALADATTGSEAWERAAAILIDELGDHGRGELALSRAVERDVRRFSSFDRLFRIVRSRKDGARLLELVEARLAVAEEPDEIAKLFWERARVLREAGNLEGALAALENVTMLEPDHVGALALSGEICIKTGNFVEAARNLGRLAALDEAPQKQRLMSGVAAVDLYENKVGDPAAALEVLVELHRAGLSTLAVRERLARAATRVQSWEHAVAALELLMEERETREGRMEAARLALAVRRDELHAPEGARSAAARLLAEAPEDAEALDFVLSGALPAASAAPLLQAGQQALVAALAQEPLDAERVNRLARIALHFGNSPLRQAALGALVALGRGSPQVDAELQRLDERVARLPQIAVDAAALPELCDPYDGGPVGELMVALATTFAEAVGPGLQAFGVGKRERVDPRAGLPIRNEVAAWAGALGVGDFELYVGGTDPHGIAAVPLETPCVVIGASVTAPLAAPHRAALARELFGLRRGTTLLRHRESADVAALVVAACRVGGVDVPSPPYAMLAEFQRQLGKEISRKARKVLPDLARAVAHSGQDPVVWAQAARASLDRLAAIAAGDVSWVLAGVGVRGHLGASDEARSRAARLLGFVLSPSYLAIRERLGMGVR